MRRLIPIALLAALAMAGCGSSSSKSSSSTGSSVVASELSYFPAGTPFVLSVATKPSSNAVQSGMSLTGHFPIAGFGEQLLMGKLQQAGINYQTDIRPLFGNPITIGLNTANPTGASASDILGVWQTTNGAKVSGLLKRIFPNLQTVGTHNGAKVYSLGGATIALSGDTLLVAPSAQEINAALDHHANQTGFSSSTYDKLINGLPSGALLSAVGSLGSVLSTPGAAQAQRVPWVHAINGYGITMNATASGLTMQYRVDTSSGSLSSAQVPIATGTSAPKIAGNQPISVGVTDPGHVLTFAESVAQVVDPSGYGNFAQQLATIKSKTGVDVNGVISGLTGNAAVSSDTHTTMLRIDLANGSQIAQDLGKLRGKPGTTKFAPLGGGFYRDGHITFGVSGNDFLLGNASPAQLQAFGSAPTASVPGAQGSVAFRIALLPLLQLTLSSAPPQFVQSILTSLGDITGGAQGNTDGLTGNAQLAVK